MPQFEVSTYPSQIFWLVICFASLCFVMARYLVPRLTSVLGAREQRLQEDWDQSRKLSNAGESLKQENLERLADARGKAHSLIHQTIQEIHHQRSSQIGVLDEELTIKVKNICYDLEAQVQTILTNMEPLVSHLVKATSRRVLGQSLTQAEIKVVVQDVLKKRNLI
ncbi:MAG: hypothetical protein K0R76_1475 [Alphaproteobacteria bacterium]|jgi:F-type H+-transporting ATPase subunit b|nr:hypothetical protein [Alphaproteobacteria bacterium]MDF3034521.1 hypothetical protein [Alphaproteobacteria bacterium]